MTSANQSPVRESAMQGITVDLLLETGGGGSGRHVLDLYAGLRKLGIEARLMLSRRRMDSEFEAEVALLPAEDITFFDLRRSVHPSDLSALLALRALARCGSGLHLLHAHSTKAGILGSGTGNAFCARVLTPHAYRGMDPKLRGAKSQFIKKAEAMFSRKFDAVIAVSPDEEAYAASLGVSPERIHFIPNGVDGEVLYAHAEALRAKRTRAVPIIGFVGRLVPQKHPELFLETLAALSEMGQPFRALVIGEGVLFPALLRLAKNLGLEDRIEWKGGATASYEFGAMDVMLHTSRYESMPYVLLEAAAAGVPIVSVENAGSRAVFGELFPQAVSDSSSPTDIAALLRFFLNDERVRSSFVDGMRRVAEQFTLDNMVHQTVAVYEQALRRKSQAKA